jgi:hypothetical protein
MRFIDLTSLTKSLKNTTKYSIRVLSLLIGLGGTVGSVYSKLIFGILECQTNLKDYYLVTTIIFASIYALLFFVVVLASYEDENPNLSGYNIFPMLGGILMVELADVITCWFLLSIEFNFFCVWFAFRNLLAIWVSALSIGVYQETEELPSNTTIGVLDLNSYESNILRRKD